MRTRLQKILALLLLALPMLYCTANHTSNLISNGGIELLTSDAFGPRRVVAVGINQNEAPLLTIKKDSWLSSPGFNCLPVSESLGEIHPNIEPLRKELSWDDSYPEYLEINSFHFQSSRVRRSVQCSLLEPRPQINSNK